MNLHFIFKVLNRELANIGSSTLNEVEFLTLQGIWDEKSYKKIAEDNGYSCDYLNNVVPSKLLTKLSFLVGHKVTKKKCRSQIEQYVKQIMSITFPAGVIPLNSPFYIEKTTIEKEILTEIQKPGALVRIKAPMELVKLYELNFISEKDTKLLMDMTGGHPALVHLALYYLSQEKLRLMQLLQNSPTSTGIYGSHLYRYQMRLQSNPELATALKTVINSTEPVLLNPILALKLSNMGLIRLNQNKAVISCQLYQDYFQQTL